MTTQKRDPKTLRIPATWCFAIGLFLCLNLAAWCNTADTAASRPHKAPIPLDLPLSGTVNGNQYQKGSKIISTQSIESGKTTYLAEEEVILSEGFEVKEGAEFEVLFDRDSFHIVTMMTYNLYIESTGKYKKHAEVIKESKADVVSVQEVKGEYRFNNTLKNNSGYEGKMCSTTTKGPDKYGIGLLWNPNTLDEPEVHSKTIPCLPIDKDKDGVRAYMVAEFRDFCFVATHFSLIDSCKEKMANSILNNEYVQKCNTIGKPVYIAGDLNANPKHEAIRIFKDNGFMVLNRTDTLENGKYIDSTMSKGRMIDLILENNTNPYHKTIFRGVPFDSTQKVQFLKDKISDHFPYRVRVKVK